MPRKEVVKRARKDLREGKSPSTAAGEFVHEEIEHVRQGKHGARSAKPAVAIGLSEARRAGIPLRPPKRGRAKPKTRRSAARALQRGRSKSARKPSARASDSHRAALKREPKSTVSRAALSRLARAAARRRKAAA